MHSAKEGKKIDLMKRNPEVCFEIDVGVELIRADSPCSFGM